MKDDENQFHFDQIGFVVADIQSFAAELNQMLGVGPFEVFDWPVPGTDPESYYHGKPASWRMKIGFADFGNINIELIQPIEGSSVFQESLDRDGSSLNHLRFKVKNFDQAVANLQNKGYTLISRGKGVHKGSRWAYFDTRSSFNGLYLELRTEIGEEGE